MANSHKKLSNTAPPPVIVEQFRDNDGFFVGRIDFSELTSHPSNKEEGVKQAITEYEKSLQEAPVKKPIPI